MTFDFPSNINQMTPVHFFGLLGLSVIYFGLFFSVLRMVILNSKDTKLHVAIFTLTVSPLIGFVFILMVFLTPALNSMMLELVFLAMIAVPAVLVLCFRGRIFYLRSGLEISQKKFDELKDEFLTVASHELRTPLSVINGFAEVLVREKLGPLNDEQKRRLRKVLIQGQRLARILDNLLDLSRIKAGKIEIQASVFPLAPVLNAIMEDHDVISEQQEITMKCDIPDEIPDVYADIDRVTQILVNLLSNAIKYTHAGGTVTVQVLNKKLTEGLLEIHVIDTGIGISKEEIPKIFKEFYRITDKETQKLKGTGLGLAIVKQLVETQGGSVGVKSDGPGKGSLFYFTLPIAKPGQISVVKPKENAGNLSSAA